MSNPPETVKLVCAATMTVFGRKPDWTTAKDAFKVPANFMIELKKVERNFSGHLLQPLKSFIENPEFQPENVRKKAASAIALCTWVIALYRYIEVVEHLKQLGYVPAGYNRGVTMSGG